MLTIYEKLQAQEDAAKAEAERLARAAAEKAEVRM